MLGAQIATVFKNDAPLCALVSTYQGAPSIVFAPRVPEDMPRPYIWIQAPIDAVPWETKQDLRAAEISTEIVIVVDASESWLACETIALAARELLNRKPAALRGAIAKVTGPSIAPSDQSVDALKLSLTLFGAL